jgi:hypothetical protein
MTNDDLDALLTRIAPALDTAVEAVLLEIEATNLELDAQLGALSMGALSVTQDGDKAEAGE